MLGAVRLMPDSGWRPDPSSAMLARCYEVERALDRYANAKNSTRAHFLFASMPTASRAVVQEEGMGRPTWLRRPLNRVEPIAPSTMDPYLLDTRLPVVRLTRVETVPNLDDYSCRR